MSSHYRAEASSKASPIALAICHSFIAISSTGQITLATYLLRTGLGDAIYVVNEAWIILLSTLTLASCAFHLFFFRCQKRKVENLIVLGFLALAWLVSFILLSVIVVKSAINQYSLKHAPTGDGKYYGILLASAVGALSILLSTCILFCLVQYFGQTSKTPPKNAYDPFDYLGDGFQLSRKASTIGSTIPSDASVLNPEFYGHYSLEGARNQNHVFSVPDYDPESPTSPQSRDQLLFPQHRFVLPEPRNISGISSPIGRHSRSFSVPIPTQNLDNLNLANIPPNGRMRSISGAPHAEEQPEVPKIPQKFFYHNRNNSWAGTKPPRPGSRPSMPPAAFWMYAAEQQTHGALPGVLQDWQMGNDQKGHNPSAKAAAAGGKKDMADRTRTLHEGKASANLREDDLLGPDSTRGRSLHVIYKENQLHNNMDQTIEGRRRSQSRRLVKKKPAVNQGTNDR